MPFKDPDKARASSRKRSQRFRERHPEKIAAYNKAYYLNNIEIEKARQVAYRASLSPEERSALDRKHNRRRDPEAVRLNVRRRKQRMRDAPLTAEAVTMVPILLADPCAYCGAPSETIDHILPVVRGGTSDVDNLTGACRPCNCSKQDASLLAFMKAR